MSERTDRPFDDFFKRQSDAAHNEQPDSHATKPERPSYYYAYGPYKSGGKDESGPQQGSTTYTNENGRTERASMHAPNLPVSPNWSDGREPVRTANHVFAQGANPWQFNGGTAPKKGGTFKVAMLSMLAGVLAMGGLMFASDRLNWFGGSSGASYTANGSIRTVNSEGTVASSIAGGEIRPGNIADMVEKVSPAVVLIETYSSRSSQPQFNSDIFRYFFGDGFRPSPNQNQEKQPTGMGSGFIFDKAGYILTNEHVISGAEEIYVTLQGQKEKFKAEKLGTSRELDLAVIKISGKEDFPTLPLGDSSALRVGDWVTAIGNPGGFDHSVSVGVLSAKEREIRIQDQNQLRRYQHLLQTDAAINPGNSGGPLLNLAGEVIGINTAVSSDMQGIGFAIPTSTITEVLDNLKNNVKTPTPFIGINMANLNDELKQELKLDSTEGVIISSVVQGGPASKADLQPWDVIVELNGEKVKNTEDALAMVKKFQVGQRITVTFVRDGQKLTTALVVGDRTQFGY